MVAADEKPKVENILMELKLTEARRPETKAQENEYFAAAFRGALERICVALRMPGSPDLIESVPAEVERRLGVFGTDTTFRLLAQVVDDRTLDLGEVAVNTGAAPRNQFQFKGPLTNYEKGTVLWVTIKAKTLRTQDDRDKMRAWYESVWCESLAKARSNAGLPAVSSPPTDDELDSLREPRKKG